MVSSSFTKCLFNFTQRRGELGKRPLHFGLFFIDDSSETPSSRHNDSAGEGQWNEPQLREPHWNSSAHKVRHNKQWTIHLFWKRLAICSPNPFPPGSTFRMHFLTVKFDRETESEAVENGQKYCLWSETGASHVIPMAFSHLEWRWPSRAHP